VDGVTAGTTREPVTVGPYRLVRKLGEGGMGVVHLALDPGGRPVALKVLRPHVAHDEEARKRLGREVANLRRVRHPLIAEVIDADVDGDRPYLVTRFVPGRSLEAEVRDTGPLSTVQVARIGRDLAGTLAAVHGVGVVHRDLKPANVMLVDGEPILIDFGIARSADEARITRTGLVMGTPGYLSPELIYGDPVTTATDWWAWGATLAFAATGRQPFGNGPIETILARVRTGECDVDGVDPPLRRLLERALTVDPDRRPTAVELLPAVDAVIAGAATEPSAVDRHRAGPPAARPSAYPPPDYPPPRRAPAPAAARTTPPPPPHPPPPAPGAPPRGGGPGRIGPPGQPGDQAGAAHRQVDPQQRGQADIPAGPYELDRTVEPVPVGEGQGRHAVLDRSLDQRRRRRGPVPQRVAGGDVQMGEHVGGPHTPHVADRPVSRRWAASRAAPGPAAARADRRRRAGRPRPHAAGRRHRAR